MTTILWVCYFVAAFAIWASMPVLGMIMMIIPIWIIQDKKEPSGWQERLKNWKKYKSRTIGTISIILITLMLIAGNTTQQQESQLAEDVPLPTIEFITEGGYVGDASTYTVEFHVNNADQILADGKQLEIQDSGSYSVGVDLDSRKTIFLVKAMSGDNEVQDGIIIERSKNAEELATEQAIDDLRNQITIIEEDDISYAGCYRIAIRVTVPDDADQDDVDTVLRGMLYDYEQDDVTIWAWNESERFEVGSIGATRGIYERSSCE